MKKHKVVLTAEQRRGLLERIAAGKDSVQRHSHACILLKADASAGGPAWTDEKIAEAVEVSYRDGRACPSAFCQAESGGCSGSEEAAAAESGAEAR